MFNLSGSEIIVILLLALVILGPDKLPDAMRKAGKTFAELKKLSNGFQDEVRKGFEEPVKEVKKTAAAVRSATKFPIDTTASTSASKPRYNPAVDAAPALPAGESVAEPLATAEVVEVVEVVDAVEPVGTAEPPESAEAAEAAEGGPAPADEAAPAVPTSDDAVAPADASADSEPAT